MISLQKGAEYYFKEDLCQSPCLNINYLDLDAWRLFKLTLDDVKNYDWQTCNGFYDVSSKQRIRVLRLNINKGNLLYRSHCVNKIFALLNLDRYTWVIDTQDTLEIVINCRSFFDPFAFDTFENILLIYKGNFTLPFTDNNIFFTLMVFQLLSLLRLIKEVYRRAKERYSNCIDMETKVLESNQYWSLVQNDEGLTILSHMEESVSFKIRKNTQIKRNECPQYIEYIWQENQESTHEASYDFIDGVCGYDAFKRCKGRLLLIDKSRQTISFAKELMSFTYGPNLYELLDYRQDLRGYSMYLATRWGNSSHVFTRICGSKYTSHYQIYVDRDRLRVIYKIGKDIMIFALGDTPNEKTLFTIKNMEDFYRVTRNVGKYTYLFSFFILQGHSTRILLNLKTLRHLNFEECRNLVPIILELDKRAFYDKERKVYRTSDDMLYMDHHIYNTFLQTLSVSYGNEQECSVTVYDAINYHFAIIDNKGLRIFRFISCDNTFLHLQELQYYVRCPYARSELCITIDDNGVCTYIDYFDPVNNMFVINEDAIKHDHEKRTQNKFFPEEHYDFINDGLDGEAEALGNID